MQDPIKMADNRDALMAATVEAFPLPALAIAPNERILAANAGALALFGEGALGLHYITAIRQPMLLDAIENVLRLSEPADTKYRVPQDQRDLIYSVTVRPVVVEGFQCALVCFEDRTELHEAGQMRRDFVANVSHELRTPLTAVLGFVETLMGPAADDKAARERFLEIMEREAKRMNRIVGDLLSLSKVESERRVRPTDDVDISALLRSVALTLQPFATEKNVEIVLEGAEETAETTLVGDFDQLTQVFTNLMENAVKYGGENAQVTVCVTHHAHEPTMLEPAVRVDIADQGDGIASEHIPRLTERFYRVDSHRSREMGGTGLGLAIVKHILNRHKGRLRVESHVGEGSLFSVILPYS